MQGFNMGRYIPPDVDPSKRNWNKNAGKTHHLGNRASKLKSEGFLTVRFEAPFAIQCNHCGNFIAQGVRFNAEKRKIGQYYTTPILSFRVKHSVCNNYIEIHTDPKNFQYKVVYGGKKKAENESKPEEQGVVKVKDPAEVARLENPFAQVEQKQADNSQKAQHAKRIAELYSVADRQWHDPYSRSQGIRRTFRNDRRLRHAHDARTRNLRNRHSLHIPLLAESAEDERKAKLVIFQEKKHEMDVLAARARPLFTGSVGDEPIPRRDPTTNKRLSRTEIKKLQLQKEIRRSTRVQMDPFISGIEALPRSSGGMGFIDWRKKKTSRKRKRLETEDGRDQENAKTLDVNAEGESDDAASSQSDADMDDEGDEEDWETESEGDAEDADGDTSKCPDAKTENAEAPKMEAKSPLASGLSLVDYASDSD